MYLLLLADSCAHAFLPADDYDVLCRLDETVENRKGAAAGTIDSLPTQSVPPGGLVGAGGERLSCAVCLEEFVEGAELRALPCLHKFHKGCIDRCVEVVAGWGLSMGVLMHDVVCVVVCIRF
jgi:hypothetical protein